MIRVWGAAATYIGAVVGAGFASGQEIYLFFNLPGNWPWGLVLAVTILLVGSYLMMDTARARNLRSYRQLIGYICPPFLARATDLSLTLFLLLGIVIIQAGSGAMTEGSGLGWWPGAAGMATALALILAGGLEGVVLANAVIVPLLIAGVILVWHGTAGLVLPAARIAVPVNLAGVFFPILYASYNLMVGLSILADLGAESSSRRQVLTSAAVGTAGLSLLGLMVGTVNDRVGLVAILGELPMVTAATLLSPGIKSAYEGVLFLAMLTTGVTSCQGLRSSLHLTSPLWIPLMTFGMLPLARLGFSNLIAIIYPLMGILGLPLLIFTMFGDRRGR